VIFCHVAITTAEDYLTRRAAHRKRHLARLLDLRSRGLVVAGGPAPDGRSADLFYRVPDLGALKPLVEDDPYFTGGAWTGYDARPFSHFVEPWERVALVTDGSRRAAIVEGHAPDVDMASLALVEARGAGRLAFGGFFAAGQMLVVMRAADLAEARGWLEETGFWTPDTVTARPWLHVL
jgi:uncharacterized protein YciI